MILQFIIKVIALSAVISFLIKILAPFLEIQPYNGLAIMIVLTPSIVLGAVLFRRFVQS